MSNADCRAAIKCNGNRSSFVIAGRAITSFDLVVGVWLGKVNF